MVSYLLVPWLTPPAIPGSRRRAVRRAMDPRGTIAKRRKYGRFLPHQVDDDTSKHHLSASNYGRENEWVLLDPLAAQRSQ